MSLKKIVMLTLILLGIAAVAEAEQAITVDSIGSHKSGESFNITGTTTIENCKKIGIEIFPQKYWDTTTKYAMVNDSGRVKFFEIAGNSESNHPGIKISRYNLDGTMAEEPAEPCPDHLMSLFPVTKATDGTMHWTAEISEDENKTAFTPGKYHVNVWDASKQYLRDGEVMPNGWDIKNKKIYPSTTMPNLWSPGNEKEMVYAEFTIN
ncbi:MAG: hypothetical protein LUQ07_03900 [Methanospirillum sp.]|nr:hypothetical protein [Methanospirillum sp.]